jgi:hypothetical protein
VAREIHEVVEVRYLRILARFEVALKLGRDGRFDRDALSLGRRRHVEVIRQ